MRITPEKKINYLWNGGQNCPHCKSDNIKDDVAMMPRAGKMTHRRRCLKCNEKWEDVYKLIHVKEVR